MERRDYSSEDFMRISEHEEEAKEERHVVRSIMSNISLSDITEEDLDYIEERLEKVT